MEERDACGLVAIARKDGRPDARVLAEVIDGLRALVAKGRRLHDAQSFQLGRKR